MEWFRDWFASKYYHILYGNHDDREGYRLVTNLIRFFQPPSDACFLDAPCGAGRHAKHLSAAGFKVSGIDLSQPSIKMAQLSAPNVEFKVHDIRRVFRVEYYDYILNLFTSIGYFDREENINTIQSFGLGLKQNGILLIDFLNTNRVLKNLRPYDEYIISGISFKIKRLIEDGVIVKYIDVCDAEKIFNFVERIEAISKETFEDYLNTHNFMITNIFGNYDLKDYNPNHSERMIIVAKKRRT